MNEAYRNQKNYANAIYKFRYSGELDQAISECITATKSFPTDSFFYRILGDLYKQIGDIENAFNAYLEQIKHIQGKSELMKPFARFYIYLKLNNPEMLVSKFIPRVAEAVQKEEISPDIKEELSVLIGEDFLVDEEIVKLYNKTDNDVNLKEIRIIIDSMIAEKNIGSINAIVDYRIKAVSHTTSKQTDFYFVTVMERTEAFDKALLLIEKIIGQSYDPTIIRTLLRICRKKEDYSVAEKLLILDEKFVDKSDFNIQYELVYYYETKKDEKLLHLTLKQMKRSATRSLPISRTLYSFYLRFNMFDEAKEISGHIKTFYNLQHQNNSAKINNRTYEQFEAEQGIWDKLKNLVSEQEHNRQMIALRDLLKGFSHELGQPITNIRYAVQLHQMKMKKGVVTENDLEYLLILILNQTTRIGDMLARFRPIISSKGHTEWFNVSQRISGVFKDMKSRLDMHNIQYLIRGNTSVTIVADAVQFDQVFYNLILNSIQAIETYNNSGIINVNISLAKVKKLSQVEISFSDNGPGIAEEISSQIFEPFYSTKDPNSGGGGEGLGLFIVWNILKMLDGSIHVNNSYKNGAKFDIVIPIKSTMEVI